MSASKTASAAAKAVAKSQKQSTVDRTPEQIVADIRRNLFAGLAVPPNDQRTLLAAFDELTILSARADTAFIELTVKNAELTEKVSELTAKIEEFRDVYERENKLLDVHVFSVEPARIATTTDITQS